MTQPSTIVIDFTGADSSGAWFDYDPTNKPDLTPWFSPIAPKRDVALTSSANAIEMQYSFDGGLILKYSSSDITSVSTFGVFVDLSKDPHDTALHVQVEFDWLAIERRWTRIISLILRIYQWLSGKIVERPFFLKRRSGYLFTYRAAIGASAIAGDPASGLINDKDAMAIASCQISYDKLNKLADADELMRMNGPKCLQISPLPFAWLTMPSMGQSKVFGGVSGSGANPPHSLFNLPFLLEMKIEPSVASGKKAPMGLRLSQNAWDFESSVSSTPTVLDTSKFKAALFENDLIGIRYAGATLNVTKPTGGLLNPINSGPVTVRIRKITIICTPS